jgi:hypothetical protein
MTTNEFCDKCLTRYGDALLESDDNIAFWLHKNAQYVYNTIEAYRVTVAPLEEYGFLLKDVAVDMKSRMNGFLAYAYSGNTEIPLIATEFMTYMSRQTDTLQDRKGEYALEES